MMHILGPRHPGLWASYATPKVGERLHPNETMRDTLFDNSVMAMLMLVNIVISMLMMVTMIIFIMTEALLTHDPYFIPRHNLHLL